MPELPEVEVLARHLAPLLEGRVIRAVEVRRPKTLAPTTERDFHRVLAGARFVRLARRGKYLLFTLRRPGERMPFPLLGHLGMTGRMYLQPRSAPLPKHAVVAFSLGPTRFVFEDTRYFGRLTLDARAVRALGPEPLSEQFTVEYFAQALERSAQAIKVKLLDQSLVAGVGNIYASESLFRAGISPRLSARRLGRKQVERLWRDLRAVLAEAIRFGSTVPLNWTGAGGNDGLFYYGRGDGASDGSGERLLVYGRPGQPCPRCRTPIKRLVQAGRSTFYCPRCQRV